MFPSFDKGGLDTSFQKAKVLQNGKNPISD